MSDPQVAGGDTKPLNADERLAAAMSPMVPQIYANGFLTGMSSGDVYIALERNGQPVALLNLSYTVAKTLSLSLGRTIATLEDQANRQMLTTHDVESIFGAQTNIEP